MTEYTVDKDGNVKSKGKGKKPLPTRYMEGDIPFTIPSIAKKAKSAGKKILKGLKESPFLKKTKPKIKPKPKPPKPIKPKPKPVRKAKGGLVSRGTKFKGVF
jgi:hypothetical protein